MPDLINSFQNAENRGQAPPRRPLVTTAASFRSFPGQKSPARYMPFLRKYIPSDGHRSKSLLCSIPKESLSVLCFKTKPFLYPVSKTRPFCASFHKPLLCFVSKTSSSRILSRRQRFSYTLSQKQASSAFTHADKRPLRFSDKQDHRRRDLPAKPQQVEKMEIPFPRLMPTGEHRRIAADAPPKRTRQSSVRSEIRQPPDFAFFLSIAYAAKAIAERKISTPQ